MSAAKQINANTAVTAGLAGAKSATAAVSGHAQALYDSHSDKLTQLKEHKYVTKALAYTELGWAFLGLVLICHGSQFKNLFLCTQVISAFCFGRVKSSIVVLYNDVMTASKKVFEDADATQDDPDAKKEPDTTSKHAKKRQSKGETGKTEVSREEDAATAKKVLKVVDTEKVTSAVFEVIVSVMACHMVMEGGLAKTVVVAHCLVKATKDKIKGFLDFAEHEDLQVWLDLFLSFALYCFFGGMAAVFSSLAFSLNLAIIGSQLVVSHGLRAAEGMDKLKGQSADEVANSTKGLATVGALAAFGTLWQFWALMAQSGMAWYLQLTFLPAVVAETLVSLL